MFALPTESIDVIISGPPSSITFRLSCIETGNLHFQLNDSLNIQHFMLIMSCGNSVNFTNLTTGTEYFIYRKYMDGVLCLVKNFTTPMLTGTSVHVQPLTSLHLCLQVHMCMSNRYIIVVEMIRQALYILLGA